MTALSLTAVILLVGIWTKNQLITMSLSAGVLLMPVLLHLLEITLLDKYSFFLPVTGTQLLCHQTVAAGAAVYYGAVLALGFLVRFLILRYTHWGYRFVKQ